MSFTATNAPLPLESWNGGTWDAAPSQSGGGALAMVMEERSRYQALFFLPSLLFASLSALAGGVPFLTDVAFLLMTVVCAVFLLSELRAFSFRWGIGGLLVYGGTLIWLCYDYMTNWFGAWLTADQTFTSGLSEETVARAAAHHALFVIMMVLGLRVKLGGRAERVLAKYPSPKTDKFYVVLILCMFAFGMSPYVFFTQEGPIKAFWNDVMGGRAGGALWTVGRTGNVNFAYGAYLAQVLQVAQMASILAAFYAICIAKAWPGRLFGFAVWLPSLLLGFGTGTRGAVVLVTLPVVGFLFIRFQAEAAMLLRRVSFRAYMWLFATLVTILVIVQVQITFRGEGFRQADLSRVQVTNLQGNSMFSESLKGFYLIPQYLEPFYGNNPIEATVMPVFDTVYWAIVSPIPRAIWTTKPLDPVWLWYNNVVAGTKGTEGTTVSHGAVGYWYFRYGLMGTIQGGLIMGFLMGVTERLLRNNAHKPILILVSLGIATWLFRCFRGLAWIEFHGTLVGLFALAVAIFALRPLFDNGGQPEESEPAR